MSCAAELSSRPTGGEIMAMLEAVADPEVPVLSVIDLGLVRKVEVRSDGVEVSVAPTYTGCPATEVIERMIVAELERNGVPRVSVKRVLSPPWTTDWLTEAAREKLRAYGIAPPEGSASKRSLLASGLNVSCPRCSATDTARVSEFGSTPCKASYKCNVCLEPFEYFKCI